jgi:heme/copper-type cytochrome/quinol oxidase subunit 2
MPSDQSQAIGTSLAAFSIFFAIIGIVSIVFTAIIYWKIFSKAGYSGAMGLLMFVPIANIVALCILAFGTWPIYEELNQLRQRGGMVGGTPYTQYPQGPQYPQNPQYPQGPQYPQSPQNPQYPPYR